MREAQGPAWTDWLRENGVVAIDGIDTRSLVLHLRDRGSMWARDRVTGEEISPRCEGAMEGQALDRAGLHAPSRTCTPSRSGCGSRSSTTGRNARSCGGLPEQAPP